MILAHVSACATYERHAVPFRPPQDYGNAVITDGVRIGAESYADEASAEQTFGFNIRKAGLLPVQVVIDNQSGSGIEIIPAQTFLIDTTGRMWKVLQTSEAVARVSAATESGFIGSGAGKGAAYGAAAGSILGLALGVASGRSIGSSTLTGGVLGAAGGALIGGASRGDDRENVRNIYGDINDKNLEGKVIPSGSLASGFVFFPGESRSAQSVRIQFRMRRDGALRTVVLPFSGIEKPSVLPDGGHQKADG